MDNRLNHCPYGGYLVGAEDWIPVSPASYHFGAPGVQIGCNCLVCEDCGAQVRSEQGLQDDSKTRLDPAELYQKDDWSQEPGLVKGPMTLYSCRCKHLFVDLAMSIEQQAELAQESGLEFPKWRCAGHPPFELPGEVAGYFLQDSKDVIDFLEEVLAGTWRDSEPNPIQFGWPGFLLWHLYAKVKDIGMAEMVSKRVLQALTSEDHVQKAVAIAFFKAFPTAPGGEKLAEIYLAHRDSFDGVPDPIVGWQDLGLLFELALQGRADRIYDPGALQVIREYLMANAPLNGMRFQLLQEIDRVWLEEHRDEILTAAPSLIDYWVHMIQAWPEEILLQELAAIRRWTPVTQAALRQAVQMHLMEHPVKQERIVAQL